MEFIWLSIVLLACYLGYKFGRYDRPVRPDWMGLISGCDDDEDRCDRLDQWWDYEIEGVHEKSR